MSRKAQIQQVFIYLMAMIVIGFLVLFGYRMIDKILNQKCDLEDQTLVNKLTQDITRSTRYGTRTQVHLNKPCDYQELCIVDKTMFESGKNITNKTTHPLIWANTVDDIKYNIYLREPNGNTHPLLYDDRITTMKDATDQPMICVESKNGQFSFWLEGLGKEGVYAFRG